MIFSVIICFFINFIYKFDILLIDVNININIKNEYFIIYSFFSLKYNKNN